MSPEAYRAALASLSLTHSKASEALEIGKRTSLRYAKHGVPTNSTNRISRRLRLLSEKDIS